MTTEMEKNLISPNNSQYFSDITYYCVPPNNKQYKLFVLMSFNKELYKSTLCNLGLISNENTETFYTILDFLKNKYKFEPKFITIDFSKSLYNAYKNIFNDINIIPYFYHYCQNITRKLPQLKDKYNVIKNFVKDLLTNLKLLCFVERDKLNIFYDEIRYKYRSKLPKFFKYFTKFYFKNKPFNELSWNYSFANKIIMTYFFIQIIYVKVATGL